MIELIHSPPRKLARYLTGAVAAASLVAVIPAAATAQMGLDAEPVRTWPAAEGTSAFTAQLDNSQAGTIILTANRGVHPELFEARCVITVVDDERAVVYTYRHGFQHSICVDATAHPAGGFFVRGAVVEDFEDDGEGFVARIDAGGEVLWAVDDQALREAEPYPEGTGEFSGAYVGPLAGLAFDEATGRLMARTLAEEILPGQEIDLEQAHVIDGEDGRLIATGRRFGPRLDDPIVDHLSRDGEFLVHTAHGDDEEPYFYRYDGRRQVSRIEPGHDGWATRQVVAPIAFWEPLGTFILWTDRLGQSTTGITRVEGIDDLVWIEDFESVVEIDGRPVDIGVPERLWVGNSAVAVRTRTDANDRYLRFFDVDGGEPLAVANWYDLVPIDPVDLIRDSDGDLQLLAVDRDLNDVWLFALTPAEVDGTDGVDDGQEVNDEANGCSSTGGGLPIPALALVLIALVVGSRAPSLAASRRQAKTSRLPWPRKDDALRK